MTNAGLYVQYGSGFCGPEGWLNFDASPTLWLERLPGLGRLIKKNNQRFPRSVRFGDILRGLPVADGAAAGVYASHILEHLSRRDFDVALQNTFKMLKPEGIFRLIVPDLEIRARNYLKMLQTHSCAANDWFMTSGSLGLEARPSGLIRRAAGVFSGSHHLWMWDWLSMRNSLEEAGFIDVRRCEFGDCIDKRFLEVEDRGRFFDDAQGIRELAVEARRPQLHHPRVTA
jgi:SAM-dependent methyltransferase